MGLVLLLLGVAVLTLALVIYTWAVVTDASLVWRFISFVLAGVGFGVGMHYLSVVIGGGA